MKAFGTARTTWEIAGTWLLVAAVPLAYAFWSCVMLQWASEHRSWVWIPWWLGLLPIPASLAAAVFGDAEEKAPPVRCRVAERHGEPRLHTVVDRVCALTGQDPPVLWIMETAAPNALVRVPPKAGPRPFPLFAKEGPARLYVSRGLLELLDNRRLEAVVAHEFAHLAHADRRMMKFAQGLSQGPAMLFSAPILFVTNGLEYLERPVCALARLCGRPWSAGWGEKRRPRGDPGPPRRVPRPFAAPLLILAGTLRAALRILMFALMVTLVLVVLWLAIPGHIVAAWLGRRRELAADRAAAELTASPAELASALGAIAGGMHRVPAEDLRDMGASLRQAIVPFRDGAADGDGFIATVRWAVRTHPSTEERTARLERMSRRAGRGARGPDGAVRR
ncbi:M48 family metalloprotease [Nocardiopsis halophila]|uniref:M48 family metalloprotease n=1 Tax=Nocardiopsis halophila TaxID=141692 RepID=UPI001376B39C|nr:M48 family metalloprotease [Nocardiopsis halophila]